MESTPHRSTVNAWKQYTCFKRNYNKHATFGCRSLFCVGVGVQWNKPVQWNKQESTHDRVLYLLLISSDNGTRENLACACPWLLTATSLVAIFLWIVDIIAHHRRHCSINKPVGNG